LGLFGFAWQGGFHSVSSHISHDYTDHVCILKFIERNWTLKPLPGRSRDNFPNRPAIGDLFDLFDFGRDHDHDGG
jgi:phospholipase C